MEATSSAPDLTIFIPTRGRPAQMVDCASNFDQTKTGNTKVVFIVDEDDRDLLRYKAKNADRWEIFVAPTTRRGMVGALNSAFTHYRDSGLLGFAVGFQGDDHRPRTVGWDTRYLSVLQDLGTGLVYGNDLYQGPTMPTQIAFTTDIALAVGYMSPPELDHLCVDVVWREWGKAINAITYLDDVIVEHMHPLAGKAKNDKEYKAVNSNLMAKHDGDAYNGYMDNGRFAEDVGRIKMMIEHGFTESR